MGLGIDSLEKPILKQCLCIIIYMFEYVITFYVILFVIKKKQVGIPCKRLLDTVTVKCGHCSNLSFLSTRPPPPPPLPTQLQPQPFDHQPSIQVKFVIAYNIPNIAHFSFSFSLVLGLIDIIVVESLEFSFHIFSIHHKHLYMSQSQINRDTINGLFNHFEY